MSTIDDKKLMEDTSHAPTHQHRLILVITRALVTRNSKILEALEINKTSTSAITILLIAVIILVAPDLNYYFISIIINVHY